MPVPAAVPVLCSVRVLAAVGKPIPALPKASGPPVTLSAATGGVEPNSTAPGSNTVSPVVSGLVLPKKSVCGTRLKFASVVGILSIAGDRCQHVVAELRIGDRVQQRQRTPAQVDPVVAFVHRRNRFRLKIGLGTVASEMPGGTAQPDAPNSGGVREPSQYWLAKFGLVAELFVQPSAGEPVASMITE